MTLQQSLAPGLNERMLATMVDRQHLEDIPAPPTSGSLFSPMGRGASIEGGWRSPNGTSKARKLATALLVGIPVALVWREYWKETVARSRAWGRSQRPGGTLRHDDRQPDQPHGQDIGFAICQRDSMGAPLQASSRLAAVRREKPHMEGEDHSTHTWR